MTDDPFDPYAQRQSPPPPPAQPQYFEPPPPPLPPPPPPRQPLPYAPPGPPAKSQWWTDQDAYGAAMIYGLLFLTLLGGLIWAAWALVSWMFF